MSFRSETYQRLVRSCASTWLREHHVCEKCWKSETNSLTELIVTDPDVFFPRILWKCFNNLKGEKKLGGCFGLVVDLCCCDAAVQGSKNTSDSGRTSFQTSSFSACAHGRRGTLNIAWKVLTSSPPTPPPHTPFFSLHTTKAENRFVSSTNSLFQHHYFLELLMKRCKLLEFLNENN